MCGALVWLRHSDGMAPATLTPSMSQESTFNIQLAGREGITTQQAVQLPLAIQMADPVLFKLWYL
jgi:hypothetical protein